MNDKILIYSSLSSSRLTYVFSFIFEEILGIGCKLTSDFEYFQQSKQPGFIYDQEYTIEGTHFLKAHSLLFENEIKKIPIDLFEYENVPVFFGSSVDSFFPFDIFAASFYLVSRYEEYLPYTADKFGRFPAKESLAFKHGFLEEPVVDSWALLLKRKLLELYPQLNFNKRNFCFQPTIDIDNAYAHLYKGFARTVLSVIQTGYKSPLKLIEKIKVLMGMKRDPYDNYDFLNFLEKKYNIRTLYFVLFSEYGKYDKNLPMKSKQFKTLINKIAKSNEIGLHPSFQSNNSYKKLLLEKNELEKLIKKEIEHSRQHFLMLKVPATYDNLIQAGIKSDYSMGYASQPGFRAGTCTPFYFFNLKTNKSTNLQLIPFALMDVCFRDYLKSSPAIALKKIKKIITSIKKVDGLFVSLWHNESLGSNNQHFTWRHVYERMLDEAKNRA